MALPFCDERGRCQCQEKTAASEYADGVSSRVYTAHRYFTSPIPTHLDEIDHSCRGERTDKGPQKVSAHGEDIPFTCFGYVPDQGKRHEQGDGSKHTIFVVHEEIYGVRHVILNIQEAYKAAKIISDDEHNPKQEEGCGNTHQIPCEFGYGVVALGKAQEG